MGKLPDRHTMKQEDINRLLVDLALRAKSSPAQRAAIQRYSAALAKKQSCCIRTELNLILFLVLHLQLLYPLMLAFPVTHRDLASSLSIITGHESPDKLDQSIHWDKVTNATGTLVFLMGVAKIGYIAEQLMKHGKSPETPVALIRWGTRVEQRTMTGTLETIEEIVKAADSSLLQSLS